jgi:hypothetical protein
MSKKIIRLAVLLPLLLLVGAILFQLPPIHDRLAWRIDDLRARIKYTFNPPEEVVFVPEEQSGPQDASPTPTLPPTLTATATATDPGPTATLVPTATPSPTLTPLPGSARIEGIRYEDQHGRLNYCGPANLSMAMTFWGWQGNRDLVGRAIKPLPDDKNVMPYEMQEFIASESDLASIVRAGGDVETIKALVAGGFPALLETGTFLRDLTGVISWMGHYQLVTGYDDERQVFIIQDSYVSADHEMTYDDLVTNWRAFNYLYLVTYPNEREPELQAILGPRWDKVTSEQIAAQLASDEIFNTSGRDQFFAWFNRGTSLMLLQDYAGAAAAYDEAFINVYPSIPQGERPWRMMWYQTGPYWAYFYSGRYYDVINLATTTLSQMSDPVLEESFYWRALALEALGDTSGAVADLREAVTLNPNFSVAHNQLNRLTGGGG